MGGVWCHGALPAMCTEIWYVLVIGEQLNNISSVVQVGHSISTDDSECIISASLAQFENVLACLEVILAIHILMCNVN